MKKMIAMFALLALVAVPVFAQETEVSTDSDSVEINMTVLEYVDVFLTVPNTSVTASGGEEENMKIPFTITWSSNTDATIGIAVPQLIGDISLNETGVTESFELADDTPVTGDISIDVAPGANGAEADYQLDIDTTLDAVADTYSGTLTATITSDSAAE